MSDFLPPDLIAPQVIEMIDGTGLPLALNFIEDIFKPLIDVLRGYLRILDDFLGSWGWAIILLTLSVRVVIFPLTWKQIKSQRAMQALQPKIKELQRKFKGDRKRLQQETMRLYQEYSINPLASCFPLLLQLPIFISLYYAIRGTPELQNATFLWFTLGQPDPYYILLVVYVASQLASTELMLTPETQSQQKWIMRALPFVFIIILRNFPSGLFLYWITTNLWTVGQAGVIRYLGKKRPLQLEPVDPSKRKRSRFMEAMASAQDQQEVKQGGGGRRRTAGQRSSSGKKKRRPAQKGARTAAAAGAGAAATGKKRRAAAGSSSQAKKRTRPAEPSSGDGQRRKRPAGAKSERRTTASAEAEGATAKSTTAKSTKAKSAGSGAGDGQRKAQGAEGQRRRKKKKRKSASTKDVQTTRTGKRPVKPKPPKPSPEGQS